MNFVMRKIICRLLCVLAVLGAVETLCAQGTAFMYQGRLNDGGNPATGNYDLRFQVYDAVTNGNAISQPLTNAAVAVNNGLFTTTLDFGPAFSLVRAAGWTSACKPMATPARSRCCLRGSRS